jgi:hypothetical protein
MSKINKEIKSYIDSEVYKLSSETHELRIHFIPNVCPDCQTLQLMYKFHRLSNDEKKPVMEELLRCPGCLSVFKPARLFKVSSI